MASASKYREIEDIEIVVWWSDGNCNFTYVEIDRETLEDREKMQDYANEWIRYKVDAKNSPKGKALITFITVDNDAPVLALRGYFEVGSESVSDLIEDEELRIPPGGARC